MKLSLLDTLGAAGTACAVIALALPADAPTLPTLPLCQTEDSTACVWYADQQGNGHGRSFVALADGSQLVFG